MSVKIDGVNIERTDTEHTTSKEDGRWNEGGNVSTKKKEQKKIINKYKDRSIEAI